MEHIAMVNHFFMTKDWQAMCHSYFGTFRLGKIVNDDNISRNMGKQFLNHRI